MCKIQLTMNGKDVPKLLFSDALACPLLIFSAKISLQMIPSESSNFIVVQRMIINI